MPETFTNDFLADDDTDDLAASFAKTPPTKAPLTGKPLDDGERDRLLKAADKVSSEEGFTKRTRKKKKPRRSTMYETGRNAPVSFKVQPDDVTRLNSMCDRQDWVKGQWLAYALDALNEKIQNPDDKFWENRNFNGVD